MGEVNEPYDQENEYANFTEFTITARTTEKGVQQYVCSPENTILYLHHPDRYADYDHFFRRLIDDELPDAYKGTSRNMGAFITRLFLGDDDFEDTAMAVWESNNFEVVYRPIPTASDREAIDSQMADVLRKELDNLNPEDFA